MGREKLALFFFLMANLPRVEDFFNQGTCDWICTADTDIDKEFRDMLANGTLIKLKVLNDERVHGECANQTDVTNSSTTASLWLKMAASNKPARKKLQGRLQFFAQTILEGIFSGQFAFGGYKEINVSCIFKSTSITKSASNNSSRRLTFYTSQSVLYFVEHVANYTKRNATFLTLLRMENNTRLSVGVTGTSGSLASAESAANGNELIVTDGWLFVAVIIWIVFLLYSPTIFILYRPSEIKLRVPRHTIESSYDLYPTDSDRLPVQVTEDDGGYIEPETREGHVPPIEDDEMIPSQSDSNSAGSHEGSEIAEGACGNSLSSRIQHEGSATPGSSVVETKKPSDQESEMTLPRLYRSKALPRFSGRVNMPKKGQERKFVHDKNRKKLSLTRDDDDLPQDLDDTDDTTGLAGECASKYGSLSTSSSKHRSTSTCDGSLGIETPPTGSYQVSNDEMLSSDGEFDSAVTNKNADKELCASNTNDEELISSNRNDEELSTSNRNDEELIASNGNDEELSASNRNDEELIASNRNNEELIASNRNDEELSASNRNDAELASTSNRNDEELIASNRNDEELIASNRNDAELASTSNRNDEELIASNRNDEELIASNRNEAELASTSNRNDEELIASNRNDKERSTSNRNGEELSTPNRNDEELIASNRNDERRSASHRNGVIDSTHVVDIPDQSSLTNEDAQQESGVQSPHEEEEDEEETEYVRAIIVGETYPVGFGSCIGNKLFSTTKRNTFCNMVKLIFIFFVPLLFFVGVGDLFLALLPNLHSRLSVHLPFPFLTNSLVYGIIDNHPIVLVLMVFSAISYLIRLFCLCFLSSSTLVETAWKSCSVHRMHPTCFTYKLLQCFLSEFPPPRSICNFDHVCHRQHLRCAVCQWFYNTCLYFKPCENCTKPAPSECSKYLSLPDNISHNLEKHPDIFIKYSDSFFECLSNFGETKSIACCLKVIFYPLAVVPLIIDIFFSSPLACLCHGRLWMLNERYKNKFKGSRFILPILECLLNFFSQVWVTFCSLLSAIPLGVATIGLVKVLGSHTYQLLPHVTITVAVMHYFWSCYRSFATPYRHLAKFLASRYQKKFDKQEKNPGVNVFIHYKQGDLKVIPRELFDDACKEFKLPIRNKVARLFSKIVLTLLVFLFVFPILGSDDVSNPLTTGVVIAFFAVAYDKINNAINGGKFKVSKVDADKVVDNYIARKQDSS